MTPMTGAAGAEQLARNIRQAVVDLAIPHEGSPYGVVTVSVGVACWPSSLPLSRTMLLEQADRALYQAKDEGRNTVHIIGWEGVLSR